MYLDPLQALAGVVMDFTAEPSLPCDEDPITDATQNLERFFKGQGLLPSNSHLSLLNASPDAAATTLDLFNRLISMQQLEDRAREQLRDQADKDRVSLGCAQKTIEALREQARRCELKAKEQESKLLATKHQSEERERDLLRKLKSTETRLNDLLRSGRDGAKRTASAGAGAAAAVGNGARRVAAPQFNRFQDDLEAELADRSTQLKTLQKENARLKEQLAAVERRQAKTASTGAKSTGLASDASWARRDGRWEEQLGTQERGSDGQDVQSVRDSAPEADIHNTPGPSPSRSPESLNQLARQQRMVRELETEIKQLRSSKQDLQRQLDKASRELSEHVQTVHALRSRCTGLEFELRKADDLALRAQRAAAPDPAAAEGQALELQKQLATCKQELAEANAKNAELQQQLAKAEAAVLGNERHVGMLARAIKAQKHGEDVLSKLEDLVAAEVWPLQAKLQQAWAEAAKAQAERASMKAERDSTRAAAAAMPALSPAAASAGAVASSSSFQEASPSGTLPLSPPGPLPFSPGPRFEGFLPGESLRADSPPKLHPPPAHAFYNKTFSTTMPSPGSRARAWSQPQHPPSAQQQQPSEPQGATHGGAFPPPLPPGYGGGHAVRRSLSAGVSAERRRWQLQSDNRVRYPSPIDIIMEQARSNAPGVEIRDVVPGAPIGWGLQEPGSLSPGGEV